MSKEHPQTNLETQIGEWRQYLNRRQAIEATDVAELEDHLREQISGLVGSGLTNDEAFLVAVKRIGSLNELSREFAREHSDRLWKQLVLSSSDDKGSQSKHRTEAMVAIGLAVVAALAVKIPELFGLEIDHDASFYARNVSFFVLPALAAYFFWKRRLGRTTLLWVGAIFAGAAAIINLYPFTSPGSTEVLAALHLPIALWFMVGVIYAGARWREVAGRMDFIRFSGELLIYYVLIALGGGVLTAFMVMIFESIGYDLEPILGLWLIPCGAAGAVLIASWLVEAKQSVIENMAPVLTRLFTPLFALTLIAFLATVVLSGRGIDIERNVLVGFDLLLVVVLGLVVYSVSARNPSAPAGGADMLQVILLGSALLADAVALWAIATRISEFGFSPNRVAALGENIILLINLTWSLVLYLRFVRGQGSFAQIERWQTNYLPVYVIWAALVVVIFPLLFDFK